MRGTFWLHSRGDSPLAPHKVVLGNAEPVVIRLPGKDDAVVEVEPQPAPEVEARSASSDEIPLGARLLIKAAEAAGWKASATYARGTPTSRGGPVRETVKAPRWNPSTGDPELTPTGRPAHSEVIGDYMVLDSVAVRFYHGGSAKAVAVWEDGKMACAYRLGPVERTIAPDLRRLFREMEAP